MYNYPNFLVANSKKSPYKVIKTFKSGKKKKKKKKSFSSTWAKEHNCVFIWFKGHHLETFMSQTKRKRWGRGQENVIKLAKIRKRGNKT